MEIEVTDSGQVAIFRPLIKRIDASKCGDFKEKYEAHIQDGYRFVALNLSLVDFIDSSGLSGILSVFKSMSKVHGAMVIFGANPTVMNLFKLTSMDLMLKICVTKEEAVAHLETLIAKESGLA